MSETNKELWQKIAQYPRLGEILLQHKKINLEQLNKALNEQKQNNLPIGEILVSSGYLSKDELIEVLSLQTNISKLLFDTLNEIKKLKQNEKDKSQ